MLKYDELITQAKHVSSFYFEQHYAFRTEKRARIKRKDNVNIHDYTTLYITSIQFTFYATS